MWLCNIYNDKGLQYDDDDDFLFTGRTFYFQQISNIVIVSVFFFFFSSALESLGFGSYIAEVKDVLQECKTVALKRRKASSRLENLGIPEEELLRQQQELFAKVKMLEEL